MACGGGKKGSGNQANLAVATSHRENDNPSIRSHGARACRPSPKRPSRLPLNDAERIAPAMTKAATASSCVRDQSPRSTHHRQENPKAAHARLANTPPPPVSNATGIDSGRAPSAAPSSTDCASATVLYTEYVDINPLRKFRRIGARLE